MNITAPVYSTFALFTELLISVAVFTVIIKGYKKGYFASKIAFTAMAYEILFNISYMVGRTATHKETTPEPVIDIAIAATHGILSLVMFITLIAFFIFAWRAYRREVNFFKDHKYLTLTFLVFWSLSVLSGILFYFIEYVKF